MLQLWSTEFWTEFRDTSVDSLGKGGVWNLYGAGIFCQKNFIIKLCKGRVISVRTGLFLFQKFHNPQRVNWCAPYFGTFKKN